MTIQAIQIGGMDTYYIPRTLVDQDIDTILTEDALAKYEHAYRIEAYLENAQGFDGDGALLSKFGIEIQDSCTFVIARQRWEAEVGRAGSTMLPRPVEGDIIFLPLTKSFFEIKKVNSQNPFFQLGRLYVYRLECELFNFSHEDFATGVDEVDELANEVLNPVVDPASQNTAFTNQKPTTLNFNETNPFGDIV